MTKIVYNIILNLLFYAFYCKVKSNWDNMGVQIYGISLKLKNGLMDFNKIWYQQYSFIGVIMDNI